MLKVTDNAAWALQALVEQSDVPDGTGVRIAVSEHLANDDSKLSLAVVPGADPGDEVVQTTGAPVFLEERAAPLLSDKVLDTSTQQDGRIAFRVLAQV